ncbi:MAG: adenylyltransferase/cytidyltransferase family protein [Flavobacteriaceae bacterium]|nr:adenylyltransferase/cytidyltransferase family protein [Flavobacteriaceae bacterium]MBT6448137.1 adenylyltransferase/cytidyltransferase family protein [Flavobacteriaceae bacterium]
MKKKGIIVSGYFNPLHKGHIEYFYKAKSRGNELFVIINNDFQRSLKESKEFMLEDERLLIVKELNVSDKVFISIDKDKTVSKTLEKIHNDYSNSYVLYFANGGDQDNKSIPEKTICDMLGIRLIDGLGDKIQSSSWLLNNKS